MRLAFGLEYNGSGFHGWQYLGANRTVRTVQGCVANALSEVASHQVVPVCAGRTDSGVHALGQVIHIDTPSQRTERGWVLGLNSLLPGDVSACWAQEVPEDFHARYSATGRTYRYVILNAQARSGMLAGRVMWEYRPLAVDPMHEAAQSLLGEHDFSAFRDAECQSKTAMRNLRRLVVTRRGEFVIIDAEANAFLHHMVRNLIGVLLRIGQGKASADWAREVLDSRDRRRGGITAPAAGLYLARVAYPDRYGIPEPRITGWPDVLG
jgi:tRNA pseudouridine38-40 synthase